MQVIPANSFVLIEFIDESAINLSGTRQGIKYFNINPLSRYI